MQKRLMSLVSAMVIALAGTLLAAGPAGAAEPASQTGPVRIGDPAGERFAFAGNPILDNRVYMLPPLEPTSWEYLSQQWFLQDAASGGVSIVNAKPFERESYCITAPPTASADTFARSFPCRGRADQIWTLQAVPGGVRVISQSRGDCLTITGATGSSLFFLRLRPCGGPNQVLVISPVS